MGQLFQQVQVIDPLTWIKIMYREDYSGVTYTLHVELSRNCLLLSRASYIVGFILDSHQQILGSKKIWAFSNKLDAYFIVLYYKAFKK